MKTMINKTETLIDFALAAQSGIVLWTNTISRQ